MRLIDIFVRRPIVAVVVNLVILLVGLRALQELPIQQFPRIESSSVIITTSYVGAPADVIRGFVTTPVERAVASIPGIDYVESASVAGRSTVTVRLKLNQNSTDALAEIGARLDQVRSELPAEAESPSIEVQRADRPYATFYVSVRSEALTKPQLTDYLSREVQPRLTTLPGVQRIGLEGARPQAMRVWLDIQRLEGFGLSPADVQGAMARNNFIAAIGETKGSDVQVDLLADTDLKTPAEFEAMVVARRAEGLIRLGDVARVELSSEEADASVRFDTDEAIYLSVWPLPGSNEIDIGYALRAELAEIERIVPADVRIDMAYDGTVYMEDALVEIGKTLVETVLIVGVVIFLFLGSVRTAMVPLVAIPISLVGAAGAMLVMGFSLNLLTILAIVLAVGLVVDDAIVVVENVARLMREGQSRYQAALLSARQLFTPIVAMTITLATVYAPIGLLSGLTGVLFKEFAFTLATAVIMSGIVAVTLSPIMSARVAPEGGREGAWTRRVNHLFDRLQARYMRGLDTTLRHRAKVLTVGVFLVLLIPPFFLLSGKELAPVEDQSEINVIVTSAPDATLAYSAAQMDKVVAAMKEFPETEFLWQVVFPDSGFGGVVLKDWQERERTPHDLQQQVFFRLLDIDGLQVFPVLPPALPGAGNFDVEMVVRGAGTADQMAGYAQQLVAAAMASGLFMFADTDIKIDLPQVRVAIDRNRVADLGLDLADVGQQLAVLLSGDYVNRFNMDGRAYRVVPQVDLGARESAQRVLDLKIRGADGALIPLAALARVEIVAAPRSLNRFQQSDSFRVYGGIIPGMTKEAALSALEAAAARLLPPDYTVDYAGESRQMRQEGNTLMGTLAFAVVLIYLVLAVQFNSFRDPLVVLLGSVPLALSGALLFTFLNLTTINIYSQIGLITLVGLIAKNGILIVEFAARLQEEGAAKLEAIREACRVRLRPVLMTTAATVFGHLPLVFVVGPGSESRNSIGIVLVAGMAIGTIFTLFILPSIYMAIARQRVAAGHEPEPAATPVPAE